MSKSDCVELGLDGKVSGVSCGGGGLDGFLCGILNWLDPAGPDPKSTKLPGCTDEWIDWCGGAGCVGGGE